MTSNPTDSQAAPTLVTLPEVTTAVVRGSLPVSDLPGFFDSAFGTLVETVSAQQIGIVGAAFALHHRPPTDTADLEVGFPTDRAVRPEDGVVSSGLPAGRVARMVHAGAYDGLPGAWHRLQTWIEEQGLTPTAPVWEVYVTEPRPDMDPRDLRTELHWPLAD
ncbi:AraC family transcriptional regulator [Allosaccharopolyspora coralli]|uniref:AraC family transcriptional regulator n=1 Tax=Allosaccharopolyspora coralli TaxID=2665642 RepID=A0A5Q3Q3C2_9PSEU|nr:GyrI-like domain-containing protein [Allosaccharopolyspora coralli]QGK69098.1 AraC family transcriptional regulator [Allosaccharopolyspora coralli]